VTQVANLGPRSRVRLPTGVRDFLPRAAARRRDIAERLLAVFEQWGFERIITPMFECADVLERGLGQDARAAALRFVEPTSGEVVALRPDITPQIARLAATRLGEIRGPLRLCYEGAVMRLQDGPRGQGEILQAGVELIGAAPPEGDAEAIAVAAAALASTRIDEVRLDVGHVGLARHALASVGDDDARRALEAALYKKDRAGIARAAAGCDRALREVLEALVELYGEPEVVLARARALPLPADVAASIDDVAAVLIRTRELVDEELYAGITVDLGEVRGFDYYTGIRFSGYATGAGEAVLQGGRYDELLARYGRGARATGFAVDIEAVARAQRACGMAPPAPRPRVLLVGAPGGDGRDASRLAAILRGQGVAAAVHLGAAFSPAALLDYARQVGFSRVLIFGPGGARAYRADAEALGGPGGELPEPREVRAEALAAGAAGAGAGLATLLAALEVQNVDVQTR
jgi:ATP phosphoribosyltransferase regulatory subunit